MFLYFLVADDHRAFCGSFVALDEAREHLHAHAHLHRESDRARLEHLGAAAREFEHFHISDIVKLARAREAARVGAIDTDTVVLGRQEAVSSRYSKEPGPRLRPHRTKRSTT